MIYLSWSVWIFNSLLMVIILLNFLIAVISQSYERVVSLQNIYNYTHKAEINLEYYQIVSTVKKLESIKYMIFTESNSRDLKQEIGDLQQEDDNEWLGFVETIKRLILKKDKEVKNKISHLDYKNEQRFDAMWNEVQGIKDDVRAIREMLQDKKR